MSRLLSQKMRPLSTHTLLSVYEWNVSSQYFYKNEYYNWMADNLTGHKKVLEIGCGTGYSTLALLEKGFDVIAIEKNEECIRKAEQLVSKSGDFDSIKGKSARPPVLNDEETDFKEKSRLRARPWQKSINFIKVL